MNLLVSRDVPRPKITATAFGSTGVEGWKIYADVGILNLHHGSVTIPTLYADLGVFCRIILQGLYHTGSGDPGGEVSLALGAQEFSHASIEAHRRVEPPGGNHARPPR